MLRTQLKATCSLLAFKFYWQRHEIKLPFWLLPWFFPLPQTYIRSLTEKERLRLVPHVATLDAGFGCFKLEGGTLLAVCGSPTHLLGYMRQHHYRPILME